MASTEQDIKDWTFRGNFQEPRLSEIKSLYEDLGFSVRLAPFTADPGDRSCRKCFEGAPGGVTALYTRAHLPE